MLVSNSPITSTDNQSLSHDSYDQPDQQNGHDILQIHQSTTLDASDVLMTPKLVACGNSEGKSGYTQNRLRAMKPIQQAVVLAHCLLIEKSTRNDEMQSKWAEATVLSQRGIWLHNLKSYPLEFILTYFLDCLNSDETINNWRRINCLVTFVLRDLWSPSLIIYCANKPSVSTHFY